MKFHYFIITILFTFLFLGGIVVFAENLAGVIFPVPELGNCSNFKECADFCDQPDNFKVCTEFAERNNMISPEEAKQSKEMLEIIEEENGPGRCTNKDECETYCNIPDNMEECIIFAKEHNLIPPEELEEVEKVLVAIRKGVTPPPCHGKQACDLYCSQPEHLEECLAFGQAAGFMTPEEVEMVRKTGGKGPGGCMGKEECDAFCENPANMEECMEFGIEHGLMPASELENAKKTLEAIRKGVQPPPCKSEEECDQYCSMPENAEECMNFAIAAGFISPEEAEQVKRMAEAGLTHGPGGCKGKEECEAFCDNPDNMEECIEFSVKAGFMTPEEAEQAKKMGELGFKKGPGECESEQECKAYCDDPNHQQECFEFGVKTGTISPEEIERIKRMEEMKQMGGPGGCQSKEECESFCGNPANMEECMNFSRDMEMEIQMRVQEHMPMPYEEGKMMPMPGEMPMGPPPEGGEYHPGCEDPETCEIMPMPMYPSEEMPPFPSGEGMMPMHEEPFMPGQETEPYKEPIPYDTESVMPPPPVSAEEGTIYIEQKQPVEKIEIIPEELIIPEPKPEPEPASNVESPLEQAPTSTEEAPQSFFDLTKELLSSVLDVIIIK